MPQPSAANHGHVDSAGRHQGSQHQGGLVSDATGRVFIGFPAGKRAEIQHLSGVQHGLGQVRGFLARHPAQHHGHQPRGHLVIRHLAPRVGIHQESDLGTRQGAAVPLLADEIDDPILAW